MSVTFLAPNGILYELSGQVTSDVAPPPPPPPPPPPTGETGQPLIPTLAANSQNGFIASASSTYDGSCQPFRAFDGSNGPSYMHGWSSSAKATSAAAQWIEIQLPAAAMLYSYSVSIRTDTNALAPLTWALQYFDGTQFIDAHQVSNVAWTAGEAKVFRLASPVSASRFRLRITDSGILCQVAEWKPPGGLHADNRDQQPIISAARRRYWSTGPTSARGEVGGRRAVLRGRNRPP